eukprot:gene6225-6462_t
MNGPPAQSSSTCEACTLGSYCPGGNAAAVDSPLQSCPSGLETKSSGAKSVAQCFTQQGYGRRTVRETNGVTSYSGEICPVGTFNMGGNTAGCQKCGAGLTTSATGKSSASDCLARAGSYLDKGVGKLCPKGTYTDSLNSAIACTPCNPGVTTAAEGSTSEAACDRAIKGYKYTNPNTAEKCDLNTYNDADNSNNACTPCSYGMLTRDLGATGPAECLAPPGWAQPSSSADIAECAINYYKEGWNRNPCDQCGTSVVTSSAGSTSKADCLVPAGFGLVQTTPTLIASRCVDNSYGDDQDRVAVASARCTACPPNMFTAEFWGGTAPANGYTDQTACKVDAGWGMTESAVAEVCQVGFYNAGQNRLPCQSCPEGFTTLNAESSSIVDCVIVAGWYYDTAKSLPAPCDKGTWSPGGDNNVHAPSSCTACSTGYTTQEQESDLATDCAVCSAGYGSLTQGATSCQPCPVNTFSSGGLAVGQTCVSCASGTVSSKGATDSSQCLVELVDPIRDYFTLSDPTKFVQQAAQTDCQAVCKGDATCVQLIIATDGSSCSIHRADASGTSILAFKVNGGVDYVEYTVDAGLGVGRVISTPAAADLAACEDACTPKGNCEGVVYDGSACSLITSELDPDYTGLVHVTGTKLRSYTQWAT